MLTIHALEKSAEERENLVRWLHELLHEENPELEYVPRVDIRPISIEELPFHGTPDICIVGAALLEEELTQLGKIRRLLPTTPILACTSKRLEGLAQIEQIARLGATDTLSLTDNSSVFLRKLVLLAKHRTEKAGGKFIVVDSGKGGVGVTSVAAALAEVSALNKKRTALIDFDFETQDLSRFLQSRPFVNENFQLLIDGSRTVSNEFVDQCLNRVWEDDDFLFLVPPPPESDLLYTGETRMLRSLLSFFEVLDEKFDVIIVDAGSARGAIQKTLYRAADKIVFVLNNDPATLYSSVDRLKKIQDGLSASAGLVLVDNGGQSGLPRKMLLAEFSRAAKIDQGLWHPTGIPFCKNGSKWPASGGTFASLAKQSGQGAMTELAEKLGIIEAQGGAIDSVKQFLLGITSKLDRTAHTRREDSPEASSRGRALPMQNSSLRTTTAEEQPHHKALPMPRAKQNRPESTPTQVAGTLQGERSQASLFDLVGHPSHQMDTASKIDVNDNEHERNLDAVFDDHEYFGDEEGELEVSRYISKATVN